MKRNYFWYKTAYTPKRSVLYQSFNNASGYIPSWLQIVSRMYENGEMKYLTIETIDDSLLLISHEQS